jgi:hypothetical protein
MPAAGLTVFAPSISDIGLPGFCFEAVERLE